MMQKIPLKNKLSYLWAKAVGQERLYSRLYSKAVRIDVLGEFDNQYRGYIQGVDFRWIEAVPVQGCRDQFTLKQFTYQRHKTWDVSGNRDVRTSSPYDSSTGRSVFSRSESIAMIKAWEEMLERGGWHVTTKQPFSKKLAINAPVPSQKS